MEKNDKNVVSVNVRDDSWDVNYRDDDLGQFGIMI
jgi:hypothetical protein